MNQPAGLLPWSLCLSAVLAAVLAYSQSFDGPFIFDDTTVFLNNEAIEHLWPLDVAMSSPERSTVAGRPLVAYTFAINYAISGMDVWSYHALNLLVHLFNVVMLFAVLLKTLRSQAVAGAIRRHALLFAWGATLLWAVHPIHSETVVYIVQRTELMVASFMLLTVWTLRRAAAAQRPLVWWALTVVFTVLGLLCKEVMAVMPLLLVFYDRAFLSTSYGQVLRKRGLLYLLLGTTWALAALLAMQGHRGGLGQDPALYWQYPLTQAGVILWYLRLMLIPHPLAITHEWPMVQSVWQSLPESLIVLVLLLLTLYALVKRPKLGFLGAVFFFVLAPTSSFIPIMTEVVAERRMYVPAIAVLVLAMVGLYGLGHWAAARWSSLKPEQVPVALASLIAALGFSAAVTTYTRTHDYDTEVRIWEQTVRVQPASGGAINNLVAAYLAAKRLDEARHWLGQLERVQPDNLKLPLNWGVMLLNEGRYREAATYFEQAALREPHLPNPFAHAALCFGMIGEYEKADAMFTRAFENDPNSAIAGNFMGMIQDKRGDVEGAIRTFQRVVAEHDDFAAAHGNLGVSLDKVGRVDEARAHFEKALDIAPRAVQILQSYGTFEARHQNWPKAEKLLRRALEVSPGNKDVLFALAALLRNTEEYEESERIYRTLLRANPNDAQLHHNYSLLLYTQGYRDEAVQHLEIAIGIDPDYHSAIQALQLLRQEMQHSPGKATTPEPAAWPPSSEARPAPEPAAP